MSKTQQRELTNERPDSLKYQWRLLGLVNRSDWATSLDKSVAYEIINKYSKDFKNSRASLRYLATATGAARPNVISSVRRLTDLGPFSVIQKGSGTAATKYKLHFDLVHSKPSGNADDTSSEPNASGNAGDTSSGIAPNTSEAASGIAHNTESDLQLADLKDGLIGEEGINDSAAPVGGAVSAFADGAPTAAGKDGFEALYKAYGLRRDKAAARAAYNELNPDEELLARLIEAATAWRLAAEAKPGVKRKRLATWLREECWDEDVPGSWTKKAAAEPSADDACNDNLPDEGEWQSVQITESKVIYPESGGKRLSTMIKAANGDVFFDTITLESPDYLAELEGKRRFAALLTAIGIRETDDSADLHGIWFERCEIAGARSYRAIIADAA